MEATIFDIKHFAVHDGDGIRTTVFFQGCPLACVWCHNPEGLRAHPQLAYTAHKCAHCGACSTICEANRFTGTMHEFLREQCTLCGKCLPLCPQEAFRLYGRRISEQALLTEVLEDRDFYETSGGGVTLSGGECLLQADFCAAFLKLCKQEGLHTAVDTCGFISRTALEKVIPYTDLFLYDIKAADGEIHRRCTGQDNRLILENLRYLNECNCRVEIRIPYVPGYNDDQMEAIGALLAPLRCITAVRLLKYHSHAGGKYAALGMQTDLPPVIPTEKEMAHAVDTLQRFGLCVLH